MSEKVYLLKVYNTTTGEYESVQVTKEVFEAYRQTAWNIRADDRRFYSHQTQFSVLMGSEEDNFDNFQEFIDEDNTPENSFLESYARRSLHNILNMLTPDEYRLVYALYYQNLSENDYAERIGISQQAVHKRKKRILKKIKSFLELEGC